MDKQIQFKQEVDGCLGKAKLTDEMKQNIRVACYENSEESNETGMVKRIKTLKYRRATIAMMILLIGSTSLMAMNHKLDWGLFFTQENISNIEDNVQQVEAYDERKNVKMEIQEVINQGYGAVMLVKFINGDNKKWPQNIECRGMNLRINGDKPNFELDGQQGVVSPDGKELSYCISLDLANKFLDGTEIELNAENLVQRENIEEDINVPLNKCIVAKIDDNNVRDDSVGRALIDVRKSSDQMPQLNKSHHAVYILGIGVLSEEDADGKKGIIVQTASEEYSRGCNEDTDAYIKGVISELTDTRTGKIYKSEASISSIIFGNGEWRYFSDITEEQIPYLVATKVEYEKQDIVVYTTWQAAFKIENNKGVISWQPDMKLEKWGNIINVEEVYLSSAGVQIKENTIKADTKKAFGDFDSRWLDVSLVDDQGKTITLKNLQLRGCDNKANNYHSFDYILGYNTDEGRGKLIDTKTIKKVVINGHELEVQGK